MVVSGGMLLVSTGSILHGFHNQAPLTVRKSNLHAQPSPDLFLARWIAEMLPFSSSKYLKIMI